ncbi:hypothetical protein DA2_0666 [Desulfovibrio sp. A2]|nr:hypothetical protein DA2_0666 [Desulfovibrio sp. A2]
MYYKLVRERAWLCQALYTRNDTVCRLIKAVYIGAKEAVLAVSTQMLMSSRVVLEVEGLDWLYLMPGQNLQMLKTPALRPGTSYVLGGVYHAEALANVVVGASEMELFAQAAPLFKQALEFPIIDEWMPLLWRMAIREGWALELATVGIPGQAYHLALPSSETVAEHVLDQIYSFQDAASEALREVSAV